MHVLSVHRNFQGPHFSVHNRCKLPRRAHQMANLEGFMQLTLAFCRSYRVGSRVRIVESHENAGPARPAGRL